MDTKNIKDEQIRKQIITASEVYRDKLAGRVLSENLDLEGNKINDWFLPRTLRVKDKAIESSADAEFIDFIFSKDASVDKYSTMTYADKDKKPPLVIKDFLSDDLVKYLY